MDVARRAYKSVDSSSVPLGGLTPDLIGESVEPEVSETLAGFDRGLDDGDVRVVIGPDPVMTGVYTDGRRMLLPIGFSVAIMNHGPYHMDTVLTSRFPMFADDVGDLIALAGFVSMNSGWAVLGEHAKRLLAAAGAVGSPDGDERWLGAIAYETCGCDLMHVPGSVPRVRAVLDAVAGWPDDGGWPRSPYRLAPGDEVDWDGSNAWGGGRSGSTAARRAGGSLPVDGLVFEGLMDRNVSHWIRSDVAGLLDADDLRMCMLSTIMRHPGGLNEVATGRMLDPHALSVAALMRLLAGFLPADRMQAALVVAEASLVDCAAMAAEGVGVDPSEVPAFPYGDGWVPGPTPGPGRVASDGMGTEAPAEAGDGAVATAGPSATGGTLDPDAWGDALAGRTMCSLVMDPPDCWGLVRGYRAGLLAAARAGAFDGSGWAGMPVEMVREDVRDVIGGLYATGVVGDACDLRLEAGCDVNEGLREYDDGVVRMADCVLDEVAGNPYLTDGETLDLAQRLIDSTDY